MVVQMIIVVPETMLDREITKTELIETGRELRKFLSKQADLQYREMDVPQETLANLLRQQS